MRGWAILSMAILLLAGCSGPAEEATPTATAPPTNFEQKDEGDEGVDVDVEEKEQDDVDPELYVTVREPGGQPLAEASVGLLGTAITKQTDANGSVHFPNVTVGMLEIRVTPAQDYYKVVEVELTVRSQAITRATVTVPVADGLLTPPHRHDAWSNKTSLELFEFEWNLQCTGLMTTCTGADTKGRFPLSKPFAAPVPPGTATVQITADWESPTSSPLGLRVHPPRSFSQTLHFAQPGATISMEATPDDWDAPHAQTSVWSATPAPDTTTYQGIWSDLVFTVAVERIEGELPLDPPHPDLWNGMSQKRVLDQSYDVSATILNPNGPRGVVITTDSSWNFGPLDQLVVPGATEMMVTAWWNHTYTWPEDIILEIDPIGKSDANQGPLVVRRYDPASVEGSRYIYEVPVDEVMWDDLYAEHSKVRYRLVPAPDPYTQSSIAAGSVHVVATIHR